MLKWLGWLASVRSIIALAITGLFVYMGVMGKIDAKDVLIVAVLVFNFYFLAKKRNGELEGGAK